MDRRLLVLAATLLLLLALPSFASASGTDTHGATKVTICHATGAGTWVTLRIDDDSIVKRGHGDHENDVIPPFSYTDADGAHSFAGLNWDSAGRAIWNNDCTRVATPADAPSSATPMSITFVARVCDSYADVFANRSRNNLMESLQDLGADTPYSAGAEVLPTVEATGTQAAHCRPLSGWQFALGTGYQSRADKGAWGALSKVTNPYTQTIVTRPTVPLPNVMGGSTGTTIDGAVTVELTAAQARLAQTTSKLWVQGGVPGDPVLTGTFGNQFAFAALRCAVDNLNGDNVEWIRYPQGHTDVFCYAYLVDQTPRSGTITIVKQVSDPSGAAAKQTATFSGSVSYTDGGLFQVAATSSAPGRVSFVRDATAQTSAPWSINELPQPGWRLDSISCVSTTGQSTAATTIANTPTQAGSAAVTLAAGDDITCTFSNSVVPPPSATLTLGKTTVGGTGTFPVDVQLAGTEIGQVQLQTAGEETPGALQTLTVGAGGTYVVTESQPLSSLGTWRLTDVNCAGTTATLIDASSFEVPIASGQGASCALTNTFTPNGAITLRKITEGATGVAGFVVTSEADQSIEREQRAATDAQGKAGEAIATGDSLVGLPLGTYVIQETGDAYVGNREWMLDSVVCDGTPVPSSMGHVEVTLTPANPRLDCTFTNALVQSPVPVKPVITPSTPLVPAYSPSGPGSPTVPLVALGKRIPRMGPIADVAIKVRATPRRIERGRTVAYTATVRNNGPYAARNVTATFSAPAAARPAVITPSQGTCRTVRRMISCSLGTLARGAVVTFTASRSIGKAGVFPLTGVTSTSTQESTMANNTSTAVVVVGGGRPEPVVG